MTRNFGIIPSPHDYRDFVYGAIIPPAKGALIDDFEWPETQPTDQKVFPFCAAFAGCDHKKVQERVNYPNRDFDFSQYFLYNEAKKIDGVPGDGTFGRAIMQVLQKTGVCTEALAPMSLATNPPTLQATQAMYDEAAKFRISNYARIQTIPEIITAIRKSTIWAGVYVPDTLYEPEVDLNLGMAFIRPDFGKAQGGHAMDIVGVKTELVHTYRNGKVSKGFAKLKNSWSKDWGVNGYAWIPFELLEFRSTDIGFPLLMEAWSSIDLILPNKAQVIELWLNKDYAYVDGVKMYLDQPPTLDPKTNRTLVPVRFISENFGAQVDFDGATEKITLTMK